MMTDFFLSVYYVPGIMLKSFTLIASFNPYNNQRTI